MSRTRRFEGTRRSVAFQVCRRISKARGFFGFWFGFTGFCTATTFPLYVVACVGIAGTKRRLVHIGFLEEALFALLLQYFDLAQAAHPIPLGECIRGCGKWRICP